LGTDDRYVSSLPQSVFLHDDPSPQHTPTALISTSSWTRPSFLNVPRDGEDPDSRYTGPFVSLFIPPWILVSLQSFKRTATVTKGVSLNLRVEAITQFNEIDIHDRLVTWTTRFHRTSEVQLCDVDDLPRLLPQSMKLKSLFYQLSVIEDVSDRECVVLQELGSYLEESLQVRILHLLSYIYRLMTPLSLSSLRHRNRALTAHPSTLLMDAIAGFSCSLRKAIASLLTLECKNTP
jgi:hypothetical protein